MTPILTPHCVALHDVNFKVNPQFYSRSFSLWYRLVFFLSVSRIRRLVTVSNFSKIEIQRCYRGIRNDIAVIPNAWQHMEKISYDERALRKFGLTKRGYYLALLSIAPNKNLNWVVSVAKDNPDVIFAVGGGINVKVFGNQLSGIETIRNLKLVGYVSDQEAKTLMRDCKAFIYPTFYEGFGIPPMEALSAGAPEIIVSDTEVMHEIYRDNATYIDPYYPKLPTESHPDRPRDVLERYSWHSSAQQLLDLLRTL